MTWESLRISPSAGAHLPPLFVSATFTTDSYQIHLTDLTHIWSELFDHRAIVQRSREENTSIDPSDRDQLHIFLDKIRTGLRGGKDATLALTIGTNADRPSLVLNIIINLPGGLAPLKWPVRLAAAPQSLFTSQLTIPLLKSQHGRMLEITGLGEVLRDKDHVIQKLLDKLESQGTDLGQVFPQVAGKVGRRVDRKKAEERVKGLGPFDLDIWRKGLGYDESQDKVASIGDVFSDTNESLHPEGGLFGSDGHDGWWENIKGITVTLDSGKISTNGLLRSGRTVTVPQVGLKREDSLEDSNYFQVQATPPHLLTKSTKDNSKSVVIESTDDDDLDVTSQPSKIPDSFSSSIPQTSSGSKISKRRMDGFVLDQDFPSKNSPPPHDESTEDDSDSGTPHKANVRKALPSPTLQSTQIKPQRKIGKIGGKKEVAPLSELKPQREPSPAPLDTNVKPKKGKLGQIGEKKKQAELTSAPEEELLVEESVPASTTSTKRKLGTVSHGHKHPTIETMDSPLVGTGDEMRGRDNVKLKKEDTPPRETSLERADKKREQLKRELEQKSRAPVKKKRKF